MHVCNENPNYYHLSSFSRLMSRVDIRILLGLAENNKQDMKVELRHCILWSSVSITGHKHKLQSTSQTCSISFFIKEARFRKL
ncbi:hypothetical protein PNOK_0249600 [Pyrrhoderma noxium]|uniref:Uncharacterized protein n=1 Tax=Pyrrhoderma noxium TaxID=2282107 RepID=A0A286USJ2_9AGAM|nr:hypothetical protein PNOK_0249600 [Pyrrhoderma noxium]